jgi:hypothetical protein
MLEKKALAHLIIQLFGYFRVAPRERGVLRFDADAAPFFWRGPMKLCERL